MAGPYICPVGYPCTTNAECSTGLCSGNVCANPAPTCNDGIKNGNETGKDCGGSCVGCGPGFPCAVDGDCLVGMICIVADPALGGVCSFNP